MNSLAEQVRHGVGHAWSTLAEGWNDLRIRASDALTHFRREAPPDQPTASPGGVGASADWGMMVADIQLTDHQVLVRIEAPGMARDDLHLDIDGNRLSVWGEKRMDRMTERGDYRLVQCAYGTFRRDLRLPVAVDADRSEAHYRDGVLRIALPRLERSRGTVLEVR